MKNPGKLTHTYLLRVWSVQVYGQTEWRVSLQSITTGEQRGFANLERCLAYLKAQVEAEWNGLTGPQGSSGSAKN